MPSFESIFNEIPSESVIPSPIGDFSNKYERDALLQIRRSKTAEEWKVFVQVFFIYQFFKFIVVSLD